MLIQRLLAGISIIGLLLPAAALADSATFERAVSVYLRGFEECVNAHTLRGKNVQQAKRKYQEYLRLKDEAAAIDPSILTTSARSMQQNLRYCEKARENILRAEAMPIMDKAFAACDSAEKAMEEGDFEEAGSQMAVYEQSKTEALLTTESILETFSVASKVRLCGRVAEKISREQEKMDVFLAAAEPAVAPLEEAKTQCEQITAMATEGELDINNIDVATNLIAKSKKNLNVALSNDDLTSGLARFSQHELTGKINTLAETVKSCHAQSNQLIATADKQRNQLRQQVNRVADAVQKAAEQCRTARNMLTSNRFAFDQLSKIQFHQNESNSLETKARNDKQGLAVAQQYPEWNSSQQVNKTLNEIDACQRQVAAQIDSKQQEWLAIKEAEAKRKAEEEKARLAKLEMEKEKARKEEEKSPPKPEEVAKEATGNSNQSGKKEENIKNSWLDLLPGEEPENDDLLAEEDREEEEPKKEKDRNGSIQRSWTDLIPN